MEIQVRPQYLSLFWVDLHVTSPLSLLSFSLLDPLHLSLVFFYLSYNCGLSDALGPGGDPLGRACIRLGQAPAAIDLRLHDRLARLP